MAKSKRLDPKELITALVNKQLEPYNKTLEDVKQEKDWYEIYTCTPKQYDDWLTWGADFIYNNSKDPILKTSKKMCKQEMGMLGLYLGLRIELPETLEIENKDSK